MTYKDYRYRRNICIIFIVIPVLCSLFFFQGSFKTINDVEHIKGIIAAKQIVKERWRGNNYRYAFVFKLDNLSQNLGIFLTSGKEAIKEGNYYDSLLQVGQPITVYYDNNFITKSEDLTSLLYKVEYHGQTIFERGTPRGWILGLIVLAPVPIFIFLLFWLKRKYEKAVTLLNPSPKT